MPTARVRGIEMAYLEGGGHPPVLLIHGFPLDSQMWRRQVPTFGEIRHVIAPDLIGFGASDRTVRETLDEHADDLAGLLDAAGIPRAIVVGLSMGGYVAFSFWRRHRDRVAGLVLSDTRPGADSESGRAGRYQVAAAVEERGVSAVADGMLPKLLGPDASAEMRDEVYAMMMRQPAGAVAGALRAMAARPDSTGDLGSIDVPTLIVVGANDAITPPEESEAMAAAIPGAELVVVPQAGHLAPLEEPGAFNAALRHYLEETSASPRRP